MNLVRVTVGLILGAGLVWAYFYLFTRFLRRLLVRARHGSVGMVFGVALRQIALGGVIVAFWLGGVDFPALIVGVILGTFVYRAWLWRQMSRQDHPSDCPLWRE